MTALLRWWADRRAERVAVSEFRRSWRSLRALRRV